MKNLKLALALALTSAGATLATSASAQQINPRATEAAQGLCEAFKVNHGKACTPAQQSGAASVLDRFSKMAAVTTQEEYNTRQSQIIDALAQTFGMTREQFTNPPGMAERRAQAELDARTAQFCAGFEIDHARPCTKKEQAAIHALLVEFSSAENKQTQAERVARVAAVFGLTTQQFQNPPDKDARRFAAARCAEAQQALNVTCTDAQRSQLQGIFKRNEALPPATTGAEYQQRMQDLVNALRTVFGLPTTQTEPQAAPATRTLSSLNIA